MLNKELLLMGLKRDYGTLTVAGASSSAGARITTWSGDVHTLSGFEILEFPNNEVADVEVLTDVGNTRNMMWIGHLKLLPEDLYQDAYLEVIG